jgi:hypothetical protein
LIVFATVLALALLSAIVVLCIHERHLADLKAEIRRRQEAESRRLSQLPTHPAADE